MKFEEPTLRPPVASGYFRVGTVSPKITRSNQHKPPVEMRRRNFKQGINVDENRKRRSRMSNDIGRDKKRKVISHRRSTTSTTKKADINDKKLDTCEGSAKEKLIAFYTEHNPGKLSDVDKTIAKYSGNEMQMFKKLAKKYNVNPAVFGVGSTSSSTTPTTNNTTAAFKAYASDNNAFESLSLTSPKAHQSYGFKQASSDTKGKGRSTIR